MRSISILLFILIFPSMALAQHFHAEKGAKHPWRLALLMGHTMIPEGEKPHHLLIPSWGFDVEYWFEKGYGLGLHNDMELASFIVGEEDEVRLERSYPLVFTLDLLWRPKGNWVLLAGFGREFEPSENYTLIRGGLEFEYEIGHHWDVVASFFYDNRFKAFDTWTLAMGIGKRF